MPTGLIFRRFRNLKSSASPTPNRGVPTPLPSMAALLVTGSSPRTADLLESRGLRVKRLDISELQKAEAALTCLSLLYSMRRHGDNTF